MAPSTRLPRAAAAVAAVALAAATLSRATDTPAADNVCRAITHFNVIALEDFHLTSSEVLGPLAVGGDARLEVFAVNPKGACDRDGRTPSAIALAVGGRLRADNGQINAGKVLVGRGKYAGTSVGLRCAKVVHQEVDLEDLEEYVTDTHAKLCERRPA